MIDLTELYDLAGKYTERPDVTIPQALAIRNFLWWVGEPPAQEGQQKEPTTIPKGEKQEGM